jgi:trehalose 6-phosphate synthase/phosphatase
MDEATAATPGTLVETKTASLAWHYRMAEPQLGAERAEELWRRLERRIEGEPVELLRGEKVVEVRSSGVHKGGAVARVLSASAEWTSQGTLGPSVAIAAMGDDATDEDLFRALPPNAMTISVGYRVSDARYRVARPSDARALLARVVEGRR